MYPKWPNVLNMCPLGICWKYFGNISDNILNVMSDNMLDKWQDYISNVPRMYLVVKG